MAIVILQNSHFLLTKVHKLKKLSTCAVGMIFAFLSGDKQKFLLRFFQKADRGQGDNVPLWNFKGQSPLTSKNSQKNLRKKILTITI